MQSLGESVVAGAGKFDAGGDDGGVEVEDGAQLDLDAELDVGGRQGLALDDPAAATAEGGGEVYKQAVALFVGEGLDVERFHDVVPVIFIGKLAEARDRAEARGSRDLGKVQGTRYEVRGEVRALIQLPAAFSVLQSSNL